jgi:hypothetical protein
MDIDTEFGIIIANIYYKYSIEKNNKHECWLCKQFRDSEALKVGYYNISFIKIIQKKYDEDEDRYKYKNIDVSEYNNCSHNTEIRLCIDRNIYKKINDEFVYISKGKKGIRKFGCCWSINFDNNKKDTIESIRKQLIKKIENESVIRFQKRKKYYNKDKYNNKEYELLDTKQANDAISELNEFIECYEKDIRYIPKRPEKKSILEKKLDTFPLSDTPNLSELIMSFL